MLPAHVTHMKGKKNNVSVKTIITPQVDIVELILDAANLPEQTDAFEAALDAIAGLITAEQREALWDGAMQMLVHGQESSFRVGWELRGQVK